MVSIPVSDPTSPNYRITPGTGYDGVMRVSTGTVYGTGTLLPGGRHVLTAAHVVDDAVLAGLKVFLNVPGSAPTLSAAALTLHPVYETVSNNNDLAIIRLSEPSPVSAERFDLYRDRDEVGQSVTTSPGDSGGPLLIDGRIAGLASYIFSVSRAFTGSDSLFWLASLPLNSRPHQICINRSGNRPYAAQ